MRNSSKIKMSNETVIVPAPLKRGDTIAIVSPAGPVDAKHVAGAKAVLEKQGWNVRVGANALGHKGNYSGTDAERYADISEAFLDPEVRCVLCSRGGYGVVHIMDQLSHLPLRDDPKWVIGFSDISAMHALMHSKGIASIHGSMAKHIAKGANDVDNARLFDILTGTYNPVTFDSHRYDRPGVGQGQLLGGNLAVLADLIDTPYNIIKPGSILFIEDVSEPIYKIERMLYQLRLSGVLGKLSGLVVGQFTEYRPDASYKKMEDMIADMVAPYSYPVAFDVPIGHVEHNIPVVEGMQATLKVTTTGKNHLIYWG